MRARRPTDVTPAPPAARPADVPPPPRRRFRPRRSWIVPFVLVSLLVHVAALLVTWLSPAEPPPDLDQTRAESPPMSFEIVQAPETALPPEQPQSAPAAPPSPPQPPQPPQPQPPPPPAPEPPAPTPPAPPAPAPPPPTLAPPPPPPTPPPEPPPVRLERPPLPPSDFVMPEPEPPAPETPPTPPAPRPPQPSPQRRSPFAGLPMLSAPPNPRPQPPRSADRGNGDYFIPPTSRGRAIDQSIGPAQRYTMDAPRYNPRDRNSDIQVSGAQVGSDWIHDLQEWWYAHRIYPPGAGERGESGTVQLHLQVDRTGKVLSVEVVSTSGSKLLDTGALATFRGRNLPPFPVNTPENMADINLTIQYILTR